MSKEPPDYLSYLLRLWRAADDDGPCKTKPWSAWRASLQSSLAGEQRVFASLDDLFAFLRRQTGVDGDEGEMGQPRPPVTLE
jgi:hypothetical protein